MPIPTPEVVPEVHHLVLDSIFQGIEHPISTSDLPVHQYRGIKYASIPARFKPSKIFASYPPVTDATKYGPICPQIRNMKSFEEIMFGLTDDEIPKQPLIKQNEFECLNLNITCPGGLNSRSHLPVMVWIHGGSDRGSGSSWAYDGGHLVRKSMLLGKPIIMVTFNFRLGLFGFAASPAIREDNKASGDEGVGNYGLRDQRTLLQWLHRYIVDFGGDPNNITLFGESTGAADIMCHLLSTHNEHRPLFSRAIVQSALMEYNLPDVATAGWHLNRAMSTLRLSTLDQLRAVEPEQLVQFGQTVRVVDDGVFLRPNWKDSFIPEDHHRHHHRMEQQHRFASSSKTGSPSRRKLHSHSNSRSRPRPAAASQPGVSISATLRHLPPHLQPLIIGDCAADSSIWSTPVSFWTAHSVARRLKAVCQSLPKSSALLNAYDIVASPYANDADADLENAERMLELVNDARIAWPTECLAVNAKRERGNRGVWRYVWDQDGPVRHSPHHASELIYLFDNVPGVGETPEDPFPDTFSNFDDDDMDMSEVAASATSGSEPRTALVKRRKSCLSRDDNGGDGFELVMADLNMNEVDTRMSSPAASYVHDGWMAPVVDSYSYTRVRDAIQERWIAFANGETPWNEEKVWVFGPEAETGERSRWIFDGRRRRCLWKEVLQPLGMSMVMKVGVELSRGPPLR
ncbi:alpha/beta-hydrolase [Marasmius fiardii PR-910]|nr:alpha/beta-hydrolase [Marasmius fiardii PR-910]